VSQPLDELLKRLEHLERRVARLEALAGIGKSNVQQAAQLRAAIEEARALTIAAAASPASSAVPSAAGTSSEIRVVLPHPVPGAQADDDSPPAPTASVASAPPPTLRLAPIPPKEPSDSFPDLSLLDEKVERKKGPAQKLDVRCALEDYPRICAQVQQLWGSPECEAYINTLVIDTRGSRKGFPPPMMEELLYLGRLARALVILSVGGDLWDAYDQVGDRR
jgi:hypothetical protein